MNKKPHKVDEPTTPYPAKQPAKATPAPKPENAGVRYLDQEKARKLTEEILDQHKELFRKLAQ